MSISNQTHADQQLKRILGTTFVLYNNFIIVGNQWVKLIFMVRDYGEG